MGEWPTWEVILRTLIYFSNIENHSLGHPSFWERLCLLHLRRMWSGGRQKEKSARCCPKWKWRQEEWEIAHLSLSNQQNLPNQPYIMKAPGCSNLIPRIPKPGLGFQLWSMLQGRHLVLCNLTSNPWPSNLTIAHLIPVCKPCCVCK